MNIAHRILARRFAGALVLVPAIAGAAAAQLPNVSPAAFALGGNFTAAATGYNAVAWNPAMLGTSMNPGFSLALPTVMLNGGMNPIDGTTLKPYSGKYIDDATKNEWLQRVTANGGEKGNADVSATVMALSAGPVALQVSENMYVKGTMSPDMVELMLFGNAGKTGTPRVMNFAGTDFVGASYTTAALAFGMPLRAVPGLSVGITGKYIVGTGMIAGRDNGSYTTLDSIHVQVPFIYSDLQNNNYQAGKGIGIDLGAAYQMGRLTLGGTLRNAMNSFKWDTSTFRAKAGLADISADSTNTKNFSEEIPYKSAPQAIRDLVTNDKFKPELAVGAAYRLTSSLLVTGDVRQKVSNSGSKLGERTQIGVGAEFRGIPLLPLRVGLTQYSSGWAASGGVGLSLGPVEIGVAGAIRNGSQKQTGVMVGTVAIH